MVGDTHTHTQQTKQANMKSKPDNIPDKTTIAKGEIIKLKTRYGALSRGACWGKYYPYQTEPTGKWGWIDVSSGELILCGPGYYVVGSDDGYARKARAEFYLAPQE